MRNTMRWGCALLFTSICIQGQTTCQKVTGNSSHIPSYYKKFQGYVNKKVRNHFYNKAKKWIKNPRNIGKSILTCVTIGASSALFYYRGYLFHYVFKVMYEKKVPKKGSNKCHRCCDIKGCVKCSIGYYTCSRCLAQSIRGRAHRCPTCFYPMREK